MKKFIPVEIELIVLAEDLVRTSGEWGETSYPGEEEFPPDFEG